MAKTRARESKARNEKQVERDPLPSGAEVSARLNRYSLPPLSWTSQEDAAALALAECIRAIEVQLWDASADWTNAARIWTQSTLHPLFLKAINNNRQWRTDRWIVLNRLARMVGWALMLAGESKLVDIHHASAAFEKLRCRKDDEMPMFWCEP